MLVGLLLGISLTAWIFTVLGVSYVVWRYVWTPWKIMRSDIKALHDKVEQVNQELGLRKALTRSDSEIADVEGLVRRRWAGKT